MKIKFLLSFLAIGLFFAVNMANSAEARSYSYRTPSYRSYSNGGSLYYQKGYYRSSGTYVQPYLKTRPDNTIYNNRKYILGY